jgi:hypothetical protein
MSTSMDLIKFKRSIYLLVSILSQSLVVQRRALGCKKLESCAFGSNRQYWILLFDYNAGHCCTEKK